MGLFPNNLLPNATRSLTTTAPTKIAVDATDLYWTSYDGNAVYKVPLAGGTPTTIARSMALESSRTFPGQS